MRTRSGEVVCVERNRAHTHTHRTHTGSGEVVSVELERTLPGPGCGISFSDSEVLGLRESVVGEGGVESLLRSFACEKEKGDGGLRNQLL